MQNYIDSLCKELHIIQKLLYLTAFIRGSLIKPKWQKLASLAQEICTLKFQVFGAVFASKGYPFKNIFI